jgi:hypothetical protein
MGHVQMFLIITFVLNSSLGLARVDEVRLFKQTVSSYQKLESVPKLVEKLREQLDVSDQAVLDSYMAKNPIQKLPKISFSNGRVIINDHSRVMTMSVVNARKSIFKVESSEIDLGPAVPLTERIRKLAEIFNAKHDKSSLLFPLLFSPAFASDPAALVVGAAEVGKGFVLDAIGIPASLRDEYYRDFITGVSGNLKSIASVCDKIASGAPRSPSQKYDELHPFNIDDDYLRNSFDAIRTQMCNGTSFNYQNLTRKGNQQPTFKSTCEQDVEIEKCLMKLHTAHTPIYWSEYQSIRRDVEGIDMILDTDIVDDSGAPVPRTGKASWTK